MSQPPSWAPMGPWSRGTAYPTPGAPRVGAGITDCQLTDDPVRIGRCDQFIFVDQYGYGHGQQGDVLGRPQAVQGVQRQEPRHCAHQPSVLHRHHVPVDCPCIRGAGLEVCGHHTDPVYHSLVDKVGPAMSDIFSRVHWFRRWHYRHFVGHQCQCACNRNWGGPCGPCVCGR